MDCLDVDLKLELAYASYGDEVLEWWSATLFKLDLDQDDHNGSPVQTQVAWARIARIHAGQDYYEALDAETSDLEIVGSALSDADAVDAVDEDDALAIGLLVFDYVEVEPEHRGRKLSHALVRAMVRVFPDSTVALLAASTAIGETDIRTDLDRRDALLQHWGELGFARIPATDVMILPLSSRPWLAV